MSASAEETIEFEGGRYRVAGRSHQSLAPAVGMVIRSHERVFVIDRVNQPFDDVYPPGGFAGRGEGTWRFTGPPPSDHLGFWYLGQVEILEPIPSAPEVACQAPEWCGLPYIHPDVPNNDAWHSMVRVKQRDALTLAFCMSACAERAKAGASEKCLKCLSPAGTGCTKDRCRFVQITAADEALIQQAGATYAAIRGTSSSIIPPGYRLADGWEVKRIEKRRCCGKSDHLDFWNEQAATSPQPEGGLVYFGACLSCMERRGAIVRVSADEVAVAAGYESVVARTPPPLLADVADLLGEGVAYPLVNTPARTATVACPTCRGTKRTPTPRGPGGPCETCKATGTVPRPNETVDWDAVIGYCPSVHPELGATCEMRGPHDMHVGRRPCTPDRVEWRDEPPKVSREQRWREGHMGYQRQRGFVDGPLGDAAVFRRMQEHGDTTGPLSQSLTTPNAIRFVPSCDLDCDIPDAR